MDLRECLKLTYKRKSHDCTREEPLPIWMSKDEGQQLCLPKESNRGSDLRQRSI